MERISDPGRRCPLTYVSGDFNTGEPAINPSELAWSLAGLAAVYVAESNWLDKTTEKLLPPDFRCWNGRVRVYLPKNVRFERPHDAKRHRYFTTEQIRELGARETMRIMVQSLARRVAVSSAAPVLNIDDVRLKHQEEHFERLKRQLASAPPAEMLELLASINKELEQKLQAVNSDRKGLADQLELEQSEIEAKDDELKKSRYREENLRSENNAEREKRYAAEARAKSLVEMSELPESVGDCCRVITTAFPDRIEFTERALASARKTDFPKIGAVWTALWHIANTLHSFAFSNNESGVDLEDEFRRNPELKWH